MPRANVISLPSFYLYGVFFWTRSRHECLFDIIQQLYTGNTGFRLSNTQIQFPNKAIRNWIKVCLVKHEILKIEKTSIFRVETVARKLLLTICTTYVITFRRSRLNKNTNSGVLIGMTSIITLKKTWQTIKSKFICSGLFSKWLKKKIKLRKMTFSNWNV